MDRREIIDDFEESLRLSFDDIQSSLWTALPAIVDSVNLTNQTITAQPAINASITNESGEVEIVNLPLLVDVPIVFPKAGGFALTFPIASGDEVLIIFSSRCIDGWWQSGGIQNSPEFRMHDLSDGFAIFAPTSQPKRLNNINASSVELRDYNRSNYINISNSGAITINASSNITLNAPLITINGDINYAGSFNQTSGSMISLGKKIDGTHTHGGVSPGGANTSPPNA